MNEREAALFRLHGDRTSSLAALGPLFRNHAPPGLDGEVRFLETSGVLAAAGEPLCAPEHRARALASLAENAREQGRRFLAMPLGADLAAELKTLGFMVWRIGSEPVFDLERAFALAPDPLLQFPLARTLARRGAEVRELRPGDLDDAALRDEMERVARLWLADKGCPPLGFLTRSAPLESAGEKRFFILRVRGELQAFLAAAPFFRRGETLGYYLQDIPRLPQARAGACDLLVLESMRLLRADGAAEVRLGIAPLARIPDDEPGGRLLGLLFRHWRMGYNFRSLHDFKEKFHPTRWDPLYLASSSSSLVRALADAVAVHLPDGAGPALAQALFRPLAPALETRPEAPAPRPCPRDLGEYLRRTRLTTLCVLLFTGLHLLRLAWPPLDALSASSAYVPGDVTWRGLLLGPLFHNHWFHLTGDQLSFYAFGCIVEVFLGPTAFLLLTAGGLWLSNPLTQALLAAVLPWAAPGAWAATLAERDYGSSNAVFALAWAAAAILVRGRLLLAPFALYGLFICLARQSWLALHHLVTLGAGWLALRLVSAGRPPGPRPGR